MGRIAVLLYGIVCYIVFFVVFLYAIGFVENLAVPLSIDAGGPSAALGQALLINVLLLSVFAVQHTVMARPAFKKAWTKVVPEPAERSTYVLLASLALALVFWQWRPMTGEVWNVSDAAVAPVIIAISFAGWGLVLFATVLINHFDLFGLRQVYLHFKKTEYTAINFQTPLLYRMVRHPLLLGFMIAFWATPSMTVGHLVFALVTTAYMLVGIQFEEHDLVEALGEPYERYRERVSMIIPMPPKSSAQEAPLESESAPAEPTPAASEPAAVASEPAAAPAEPGPLPVEPAAAPAEPAPAPAPIAREIGGGSVEVEDQESAGDSSIGRDSDAATPEAQTPRPAPDSDPTSSG